MNVLAAGSITPFVVSGIATGSIYALAAVGLVLTYKTSGIFNFGHGAIGTVAAYVFFFLAGPDRPKYWIADNAPKLPWWFAFGVSVFIVGPLLGLLTERIARRLTPQRTSWKVVGTIGMMLMVQGLGSVMYGSDTRFVDQYLPKGTDTFELGGVVFEWAQVMITVLSVLAVGGLYALFRFARLGIAMQAVVDDPDLLDLQGTNPIRVRRISWIIGSTLAALSGVLIVPFLGLQGIVLTFLVVQAFGAAAIGTFSSIPLTFLGGLVIGVLSSVSTKYAVSHDWMKGVSAGLPFIILFISLVVVPKRKLVTSTANEARPALEWRGPWKVRIGVGLFVFALLAVVPTFAGTKLGYWTIALIYMVLLLSLGLLVRTAGLVSLCTATFAGIGAVAFSQFAIQHRIPWLIAMVLAGFVAAAAGALVAIPTIRLSGLFLALGTFGFGVLVERALYSQEWMFTTISTGRTMPRPSFAKTDRGYYYFVWAITILVVLGISLIHRGRLGRMLRGLGDAPTAISTLGLNTNMTRIIVFCISAFATALAGVLYGAQVGHAETVDLFYFSFTSLTIIAVLALAPFRDPWFAVFGGITQVIPAYVTSHDTTNWLTVMFGFFALRIAMEGGHHSMPAKFRPFWERFGPPQRLKHALLVSAAAGASKATTTGTRRNESGRAGRADDDGLSVDHLVVRFGGLVAVNDVTLQAPTGRITGLIGPNGAGKTTTFNSCSGLNKPSSGSVNLHGSDIGSLSPGARARKGLGRSFQIMQLGESLTVRENVALGREASQAGGSVVGQLFANRRDERERHAATDEAMRLCGIEDLADLQAGALSTGQRRLVELARCLAGPFDVLLLDEPSSGLDHSETAAFGVLLQRIVAERGCGILLVEHDMALVMEICQYIYVLDFGQIIFHGEPAAVRSSAKVRQAYLGEEADDEADTATSTTTHVAPTEGVSA